MWGPRATGAGTGQATVVATHGAISDVLIELHSNYCPSMMRRNTNITTIRVVWETIGFTVKVGGFLPFKTFRTQATLDLGLVSVSFQFSLTSYL